MISLNDKTYGDFTLVLAWRDKRYYVGSMPDTQRLPFDLVINATAFPADDKPKTGSHYISVPCSDVEDEDSGAEEALNTIDEIAAQHTEATDILFHCHAGCNRSAFLCAYWIWLHTTFDMDDIIAQIRKYRGFNCISNKYFYDLLQHVESRYLRLEERELLKAKRS